MSDKAKRIPEIDYLKCVCIVLMVIFHLAHYADKHLLAKQFVYTFHMPAFLLISGYLTRGGKTWKQFASYILWLIVPYSVMESGYVIMASLLPIRDHIANLTPAVFLDKLILHPTGPYWFIHTLIILSITRHITPLAFKGKTETVIGMAVACAVMAHPKIGLLSFSNAIYYIAGVAIRISGVELPDVFSSRTPLALLPLILLCLDRDNLDRGAPGGMAITYLVISLLLHIHKHTGAHRIMLFIGRHTLIILLFSPIFTLLAKSLIPVFSFDPTASLFMVVSTTLVIAGSFAVAKLLDLLHLTPLLLGKDKAI